MVYCPHCGTPNKPTSKFCKNCAALLAPSTDIRCPICGTMNPQSAATCEHCGTRLATGAAGAMNAADKTTPADTPEQIAPFNPPPLAQENQETETTDAPPAPRPSFARANSEWLRRIQKTPPSDTAARATPEASAAREDTSPESTRHVSTESAPEVTLPAVVESPSTPTFETPSVFTNDASSDWLRALDAETQQAATVEAAKPTLSEIKLTGDDYDYSDIGGQVTDEMKAQLEASASNISSTEDEVELARRLLGLDLSSASEPPAPLAQIETPPSTSLRRERSGERSGQVPAKPTLGEIKLTGDDYDYSDIGGQVTDEMKAQLEASASNITSTEDEVELARRLLGLDLGAEAMASSAAALPIETPPPTIAISAPTVVAEIETPVAIENVVAENVTAEIGAAEPIALPEIVAAEPIAPQEIISEPIAQIETPPAKPTLSEIKLTGDDYDYSDIGGQVTEEMKAQLEASASNITSTEDEVELARRLLGLDLSEAIAPPVTPVVETPKTEIAAPVASEPLTTEQVETDSPEFLAAIAAATAAIVAAKTAAEDEPEAIAESGAPIAPMIEPVTEQPLETVGAEPVAEIETPRAGEPPREIVAPQELALESGELPEWLREIAPQEFVNTDAVASETTAQGAMPEWVQELAVGEGMIGAGAMFSRLPDLDESERGELPDWLREPPAPEAAADETTPGETETIPELMPALELPSWFASGPATAGALRDPFETIETTGPLAGVSGILPLAVAITEPHVLTTPTPTRSDGGRIFQTMLADPLAATASVRAPIQAKRLLTPQHIVYLIIFFAALIPLFLPFNSAGIGLEVSKSPSALFYDQLQAVEPGDTVLLAFEYTPGQAVELDPASRAIVNDLAARKANIIAISSNVNGASIAAPLLRRAQETDPKFTFVNVGYIPGNEAGLRALAKGWLPASRADVNGALWGALPLSKQVRGMEDLALTVVLVGDEATLRAWMEQVQPNVTTPIIAATSAQLEPQARNYVNARQLQASLRGLTGAAELELLSNQTGQAVKTVDALSFVMLALAGIIIAANVLWVMRRGKGRK